MSKKTTYKPPYEITEKIVNLISEISEIIGSYTAKNKAELNPKLRRSNRLQTIQASLAIENNTLSLKQVTAIINGKQVLGKQKEIMEVKNAFAVYEQLEKLNPFSQKDLLNAHKLLMNTLVEKNGIYRTGGVGIIKGKNIVHVAPPAKRVPELMENLFDWLKTTNQHPLIKSSVFHYEFEFIHPFSDGNGRMGRFWQTVILSKWKPILAYLPVETVIQSRQKEYYKALEISDQEANSTCFIEFMLSAVMESLSETIATDQVSDQETDQVKKLVNLLEREKKPQSAVELMEKLSLSHRPTFRKNYLHPALEKGLIEMTIPEKPNSRLQKYQIKWK